MGLTAVNAVVGDLHTALERGRGRRRRGKGPPRVWASVHRATGLRPWQGKERNVALGEAQDPLAADGTVREERFDVATAKQRLFSHLRVDLLLRRMVHPSPDASPPKDTALNALRRIPD